MSKTVYTPRDCQENGNARTLYMHETPNCDSCQTQSFLVVKVGPHSSNAQQCFDQIKDSQQRGTFAEPFHKGMAYYNRRKKSQGKLCERKTKTKRKPFSRRKRGLIYSDKRHASFLHASSVYFRRVNKPTRSRSTMYGSLSANKIPPPSIKRKCHQYVKNGI